jgi:hypothetical protein
MFLWLTYDCVFFQNVRDSMEALDEIFVRVYYSSWIAPREEQILAQRNIDYSLRWESYKRLLQQYIFFKEILNLLSTYPVDYISSRCVGKLT